MRYKNAVLMLAGGGVIGVAGLLAVQEVGKKAGAQVPPTVATAQQLNAIQRAIKRDVPELVSIGGLTGAIIGNEAVIVSPDASVVVVGTLRYVGAFVASPAGAPIPAPVAAETGTIAPASGESAGAPLDPNQGPTTEDAAQAVAAQVLLQALAKDNSPESRPVRDRLTAYLKTLPKVDMDKWLAEQEAESKGKPGEPDGIAEAMGIVPKTPMGSLIFSDAAEKGGYKVSSVAGAGPLLDEMIVFLEGSDKAPVTLYAFVDPLCPSCRTFHTEIKPYIDAGVVRVANIPVAGVGGEQSLNIASALLAGGNYHRDPASLDEAFVNTLDRELLAEKLAGVNLNTEGLAMLARGRLPTPTVMFLDKKAAKPDTYHLSEGYGDLKALLLEAGAPAAVVAGAGKVATAGKVGKAGH